ncbi:MAG: HU family DNA-binding protein [Acidobacteria bacterium]|nr:MAG: HU family DNA-binding protein [Acidobacteriota bacterium]
MNKSELIDAIAKDAKISKNQANEVMNALEKNLQGALSQGDKVTLVGFGTFSVSQRAARTGRNPQTGKPIKIAAKKVVRFAPGKALKDSVAK